MKLRNEFLLLVNKRDNGGVLWSTALTYRRNLINQRRTKIQEATRKKTEKERKKELKKQEKKKEAAKETESHNEKKIRQSFSINDIKKNKLFFHPLILKSEGSSEICYFYLILRIK